MSNKYEVLIESDWNLKLYAVKGFEGDNLGINRIRLEFKVSRKSTAARTGNSINRIRLEFKAQPDTRTEKNL